MSGILHLNVRQPESALILCLRSLWTFQRPAELQPAEWDQRTDREREREGVGGFRRGGARASCGGCLCERSLNDNAAHQGLSTTPSAAHAHPHTHSQSELGKAAWPCSSSRTGFTRVETWRKQSYHCLILPIDRWLCSSSREQNVQKLSSSVPSILPIFSYTFCQQKQPCVTPNSSLDSQQE